MTRMRFLLAGACVCLALAACVNPNKQALATKESQVSLRVMQSRLFDTQDKEKALRTVIATLQDLAFVIDKADATLGTVSATKAGRYPLRMSVTVQPKGTAQMRVRANAQVGLEAVEDPVPYQQFFEALSKAMFLTAHTDE